ncbi:MAG: hypothetical protein IT353_09880 [Gemmatimonadaceae bacterium]|nr:hypothetical protein [Gemmatimonadaceae bacterium]
MRVELAEILRCPEPHEAAALIALASAREHGVLTSGVLGCPLCGAEYSLEGGAVSFLRSRETPTSVPLDVDASHESDELSMRVAALLQLDYVALPVVHAALMGTYARSARALAQLSSVHIVAINAHASDFQHVDALWLGHELRLPFGDDALVAAAVDASHASYLADAVRVVRPGGRVIAPVTLPAPAGCRELARDDREWVAEVVARNRGA